MIPFYQVIICLYIDYTVVASSIRANVLDTGIEAIDSIEDKRSLDEMLYQISGEIASGVTYNEGIGQDGELYMHRVLHPLLGRQQILV